MACAPLAGNKIHNLPGEWEASLTQFRLACELTSPLVQVSYHLPSSAQTFTSLFSKPQQVYVHAAPGRNDVGHDDEAWGAIYLKTVVQGIVMAR